MTNEEIFKKTYVDLFHPEGIELISTILFELGYNYSNLNSRKAREEGLDTIRILLDLELIEVFNWGKCHEKLKGKHLTKNKIMEYITEIWFLGANVSDFYGMLILKYKDWYIEALKKEGLTSNTNWKAFVKEKIGDLEKWIEENRPKTDQDQD